MRDRPYAFFDLAIESRHERLERITTRGDQVTVRARRHLAEERVVADRSGDRLEVRKVLLERNVVHPRLDHIRVPAGEVDHRGAECSSLEDTRGDGLDHGVAFERCENL